MKTLFLFSTALLAAAVMLSAAPPAATPAKVADKAQLPVFADGPHKGMNAVFESEKFDATIDANLRCIIQPKEDGKKAGSPVIVVLQPHYIYSGATFRRGIEMLEKPPAPKMNAQKVTVEGRWTGSVSFDVDYEFAATGVTITPAFKDPPGQRGEKEPTVLIMSARFPPVPGIPAGTPEDKIAQLVGNYSLQVVKSGQKSASALSYTEALSETVKPVERAEAKGLWGSRQIAVQMPPTRERQAAHVVGWVYDYTRLPPYKGFSVGRHIGNREKDKRLIVQVY